MDFNSNEGATTGGTMHGIVFVISKLNSTKRFNGNGLLKMKYQNVYFVSFKPLIQILGNFKSM